MNITDENYFHLLQLANQEYSCSQILLQMTLDDQGKENQELIRAVGGLVGGLGYCGKLCGALTSGACLLSLYAGKGSPDEVEDSRLNDMIAELVQWFENTFGARYGGTNCQDILEGDYGNRVERCPEIPLQTQRKVHEILAAHSYDILTGRLEA